MIPASFLEDLKYASDIEQVVSSYVRLKRRGRTLVGLCPFHSEKTPSFTVYPDSQSYYCFGCQNGGDVITFIRQVEHLEYIEALKFLCQRAGMTLPEDAGDDSAARQKTRILELNRAAARFFHDRLRSEEGRSALAYLTGRGLTGKTIRTFGLGYAPDSWDNLRDHLRAGGFSEAEMLAAAVVAKGRKGGVYDLFRGRVIFPIIDLRGNVVGFGGRLMGDGKGPKYLNSSDTPVFKKSRNLYALNFAKAAKTDMLILAEGYMDVIAIHQAGFPNAVATLGTSLTQEQARLISQYAKKVAIAYDSDGAGQNAARRALGLFSQTEVSVSVLEMTGAKDPDEFIRTFGPHRFENLLAEGKSALRFEIDKLRARYDLDDAEGRVAFLSAFCKLMATTGSDLQRDVYISEISQELDVSRQRLLDTVESIRKRGARAREREQAHNLRPYVQDKAGQARGAVRKEQLTGLVAEEKLIAMLMLHPDYYDEIRSKITAKDFCDEDHAAIWRALSARLEAGAAVQLIHLSEELSPGQMGKLTGLLTAGRELHFVRQQAGEYITAIHARKDEKTPDEVANMTAEQYRDYITSLAAKKK